ncbi:MAG: hypothetical protein ACSLEX_04195 [Minisyncoccota bacterium]
MTTPKKNPLGVGVFSKDTETYLIYQDSASPKPFLLLRKSKNGLGFSPPLKEHFTLNEHTPTGNDTTHIRYLAISKITNDAYRLTYTRNDEVSPHLYTAISSDGFTWQSAGILEGIDSFGVIVPEYHFEQHSILYYGNGSIHIAFSRDHEAWHLFPEAVLLPRKTSFDCHPLSVAQVFLTDEGIALFYFTYNAHRKLCLGAALFDKERPGTLLWRSESPLWEQPAQWDSQDIHVLGITTLQKKFLIYFQKTDGEILTDTLRSGRHHLPDFLKPTASSFEKKQSTANTSALALQRFHKNPILEPVQDNHWEAFSAFNAAALTLNDTVHLLYRAQGHNGLSVLGYASSDNGYDIDTRCSHPVYVPSQIFEIRKKGPVSTAPIPYLSGGGQGGCEDPRIVQIGDRIYMTYVAFDGCHPPGVALTSISVADFQNQQWNWESPKLLSRPGETQKNWVLFPEKINGRFAILHSISPHILIDFFDTLDDTIIIDSYHNNHTEAGRWDNILRGVGAPPLRTTSGWLVLYHAMDRYDPNKYKVGAMLLDLHDPTKVLYRSRQPILEPREYYENEGHKTGVVYVCGAVIKDDTLFVYYGGSDRCVAVASTPLSSFVQQIISHQEITLLSSSKNQLTP